MILTRRQFFKTTAIASTALAVMSSPLAAFADCPRQAAFRMKDRLIKDYNNIVEEHGYGFVFDHSMIPEKIQWKDDLAAFLEHLSTNITGLNNTFDEKCNEIRIILKGVSRDGSTVDVDIMNCSAEAFTICLIRDCLKNHKLPIVVARNWKQFAIKYTKYVMSA